MRPVSILALATPDKVEEKTIELNDVVHPFYLITAIMIVSGFVSFFLPLPEVTAEGEVQDQTQTPLAADLGSRSLLAKANGVMWYPSEVDVSIRPGWYYHASEDCQVKTPQKLIDIYYSSIGKNSLLLLNMPPDKRGLIHENDRHSLLAMKRILQQTFAHNYMSDIKKTTLSSVEQKELTDDALETY